MSNKTRKVTVKLQENEAFVVADRAQIQHMSEVYKYLATDKIWKDDWAFLLQVAENIEFWLNQTSVDEDALT